VLGGRHKQVSCEERAPYGSSGWNRGRGGKEECDGGVLKKKRMVWKDDEGMSVSCLLQ